MLASKTLFLALPPLSRRISLDKAGTETCFFPALLWFNFTMELLYNLKNTHRITCPTHRELSDKTAFLGFNDLFFRDLSALLQWPECNFFLLAFAVNSHFNCLCLNFICAFLLFTFTRSYPFPFTYGCKTPFHVLLGAGLSPTGNAPPWGCSFLVLPQPSSGH